MGTRKLAFVGLAAAALWLPNVAAQTPTGNTTLLKRPANSLDTIDFQSDIANPNTNIWVRIRADVTSPETTVIGEYLSTYDNNNCLYWGDDGMTQKISMGLTTSEAPTNKHPRCDMRFDITIGAAGTNNAQRHTFSFTMDSGNINFELNETARFPNNPQEPILKRIYLLADGIRFYNGPQTVIDEVTIVGNNFTFVEANEVYALDISSMGQGGKVYHTMVSPRECPSLTVNCETSPKPYVGHVILSSSTVKGIIDERIQIVNGTQKIFFEGGQPTFHNVTHHELTKVKQDATYIIGVPTLLDGSSFNITLGPWIASHLTPSELPNYENPAGQSAANRMSSVGGVVIAMIGALLMTTI